MLWPVCNAPIRVHSKVLFLRQKGPDVSQVITTLWVLFQREAIPPMCLGHPHLPVPLHQIVGFWCYFFLLSLGFRWSWVPYILKFAIIHGSVPFQESSIALKRGIRWGPLSGETVIKLVSFHTVHTNHLPVKGLFFFFSSLDSWSCCNLLGKIVMISLLILDDSQLGKCGQGQLS